MDDIDAYVLGVYDEIFALGDPYKISEALASWWAYLASNCSPDNPCIECYRELRSVAEEEP